MGDYSENSDKNSPNIVLIKINQESKVHSKRKARENKNNNLGIKNLFIEKQTKVFDKTFDKNKKSSSSSLEEHKSNKYKNSQKRNFNDECETNKHNVEKNYPRKKSKLDISVKIDFNIKKRKTIDNSDLRPSEDRGNMKIKLKEQKSINLKKRRKSD